MFPILDQTSNPIHNHFDFILLFFFWQRSGRSNFDPTNPYIKFGTIQIIQNQAATLIPILLEVEEMPIIGLQGKKVSKPYKWSPQVWPEPIQVEVFVEIPSKQKLSLEGNFKSCLKCCSESCEEPKHIVSPLN